MRGKRALDGLENEIRDHIERETQENVDRGMTPDEARRQALLRFGSVTFSHEGARAVWISRRLEEIRQDVGYAFRTLRRNGGATVVGILVMALAIGANTAVFSVIHAVLLNPLPYPDPQRIVTLTYRSSGATAAGDRWRQVSIQNFLAWQAQSSSFDAMAYYSSGPTSVRTGSAAEYATVARVTEKFFRVLGTAPSIGRAFMHEEAREEGSGAAIVSDGYARQHFGDPAGAIGRTLRLFNLSVPIVGVLPPSFDFPLGTEVWLTDVVSRSEGNRRGNNVRAIARLKRETNLDQAQSELATISQRLEAQYPDTNKNIRVVATRLQRDMVGDVSATLYLVLGAVTFVLLIACATMATLLLARATSRAPEMAIRAALGAGRGRVMRQLLVEAFVQAMASAAIGITVAIWMTRVLVALSPNVPRLDTVEINGSVVLFTVALSAIVTVLFGLPSALRASKGDANAALRHGTARLIGGESSRAREVLVVAEIALAVTLVVTAGLLVRSLIALQHVPLGFEPANVVVMEATARPLQSDWSDSRGFFRAVLDDIKHVPGVIAAGVMMGPPGRVESDSSYWIDRMPKASASISARPAAMNVIAPGTFTVLGMPIEHGRDFSDADITGRPRVAIVNAALVRAAFGDRDPLGHDIIVNYDSVEPMTIIGVVGDVRQYGPAREPQPEVYMPYLQHFYNGATLRILAKTTGADPFAIGAAIQRKARERSPDVSVRLTSMDALLADHVATPKFRTWLLSLFAVVALCLAMAGVYGVMAYVAGQRSKEIGIRMALGASATSVQTMMLREGLKLTSIGLVIGVLGAVWSSRLVNGMLFDVAPRDMSTYAVVVVGLGVLSLLATYLPARRTTQVDPLQVLRQE